MIQEQYIPQPRPLAHAGITGDHLGDTTPIQISDQQLPKLVSQNAELVPGVVNKAKPPTPASNSAPSKLEEVD